jgi:hypothetical protein
MELITHFQSASMCKITKVRIINHNIFGVQKTLIWSSNAEESHLHVLADPCVTVSRHTAPIDQPKACHYIANVQTHRGITS